ncbi:MAG: class I tRNA ligase family protein, partial [Patescibacteria group bacterium]
KVAKARLLMVDDLKEDGLLIKINENYTHRIGTCYRDGSVIEPLPLEQWFIKVKPLVAQAKKLVKSGKIKVHPKRFEKHLVSILDNFIDWNVSRQIVWGIRIPAWQCEECKNWTITKGELPKHCSKCNSVKIKQDEDTFDTWFSSGQWPFATLMTQEKGLYEYFYPTSVMETGYDILRAWVARMIMIGYFATDKPPFENIFLHGMVRDRKGQKMSKSKGNVINPLEVVDKFGADALRSALVFGVKEGGDVPFSEEKVIGMRNFINKIWNMGRFIEMNLKASNAKSQETNKSEVLNELEKEFKKEKKQYLKYMDSYQFSKALGLVYEFIWHRFADYYIEQLKDEVINGNIEA